MLSDLVKTLVALGRETRATTTLPVPGTTAEVWVIGPDGNRELVSVPPPPQHPKMADLDSFINRTKMEDRPQVFISSNSLVAHLDKLDRRECVEMQLTESARFSLCRGLMRNPRTASPRDMVKFLRLELAGGGHDHMIQSLSKIDFIRKGSGKSVIGHGSESLGKTVEAIVQQAEEIPSVFKVGVPIWTNPGMASYLAYLELGVHLDAQAETVEIRVLPDEVDKAMGFALAALATDIVSLLGPEIPVYIGKP